jgi:hypothetical protein
MCHGGGLWGGGGGRRDDVRNKTTIKRMCSSLTAKPRERDWPHFKAGLCLVAAFCGRDWMSFCMNRGTVLTTFSVFSLAQYLCKHIGEHQQ